MCCLGGLRAQRLARCMPRRLRKYFDFMRTQEIIRVGILQGIAGVLRAQRRVMLLGR